ncbi:MAG TPA: YdiU family protein [Candidatus Manganitrophaceae bacterium]|nr:YdiU family protein [Candidatus Manganitrophaceae bacterium]
MQKLETLRFDNRFARLPDLYYTRLSPTPLPAPYLVGFNPDAAALIDLDPAEAKRPDFAEYFSGNRLLTGSEPLAMLYSGHQFGVYVPQLGDGRAILLGEVKNGAGERWELQLKGAGPTPYSRQGDGRAVLRSTIREYLCSEAMAGLGIPTTRALSIVGSDLKVYRETTETAAVLLRLAPTHVRFGSFQVFYYRKQFDALKRLADFVIELYFPECLHSEDPYSEFFNEAVLRTARLMAAWQAAGFAHGVMNTDNMSIVGLTFDYGPFGFVEHFEPGFICNHSDYNGRYAFNRQPEVGLWNLSALAQALTPLIAKEKLAAALDRYEPAFHTDYSKRMSQKLGLKQFLDGDLPLIADLLKILEGNRVDYTNFFRALGHFKKEGFEPNTPARLLFTDLPAFDGWAERYRMRLAAEGSDDGGRKRAMDRVNPKYILRNHLAQVAIEKGAARDYSEIDRLRRLLSRPFDEQPEMEKYAAPAPDWAKGIQVSCSS